MEHHNSLSLKLVYNSHSIWIPIDSSAKVADLLVKWGQRAEQDSRKFCLYLSDGELFDSDTLKELSIQQRETIHVVAKTANQSHLATKAELVKSALPQPLQREPSSVPSSYPSHHEIPNHRPVTTLPSGYPPSSSPMKFPQFFYLNEQKTLRPLQPLDILSPKKSALLEQAKSLLRSHDEFHHMKPATLMPAGVGANENDWLQIYTVAFFNNANIIYSKFVHKCTLENCPHTSAGLQNYLWLDPAKKVPVDIPALGISKKFYPLVKSSNYLEYFTNLFEWIVTDNFNDETKFPPLSKDVAYPEQFRYCVSDISRRVFRVYAHLYHHHYSEFADNGIMPIENFEKSFELFYRFVKEYNLVTESDLKPMEGLINIINM